ncbi:MAG: ATP-binding protein [Oscillospiraceae bacterium]|nr:ATP-binding protein [Oscillospiraceae bacterium]
MMPEISLNILDVAQNSVAAGSMVTTIDIAADAAADRLTISIIDEGKGMTPEQVAQVTDPFYTTRTTRAVGLGVPFFKMAAELTGGRFDIKSAPGAGTTVTAEFGLSHIDRMPLGDIAGTFTALVGTAPELDFVLKYSADGRSFIADTREFREILGDVQLSEPQVLSFISEFIRENREECDAGASI